MGEESVQIIHHIEDERAQLDHNLSHLEHELDDAKNLLVRWWRIPELRIGMAFLAGVMLAQRTDMIWR